MESDTTHPLSPGRQALTNLKQQGYTLSGWCRARGFSRHVANAVIHKNTPAIKGEALQIAIALGLKPAPEPNDTPNIENDQGISNKKGDCSHEPQD